MTHATKFLTLALLFQTAACDDPKSADGKDDEIEMCPEVDPNPCDEGLKTMCIEEGTAKLGDSCSVDSECISGMCLKPWGYCTAECYKEACSGWTPNQFGITYECEEVLGDKLCIIQHGDPVSH